MSAVEVIDQGQTLGMGAAQGAAQQAMQQPLAMRQGGGAIVGGSAHPVDLLQIAVERGAPMDLIERLMALKERHEANEARKAFVDDMAEFKKEPLEIFKRKAVGFTTKDGDFVGYKHAELSDVAEVVVPALARHGFSHRWDVKQEAGRITVACIVTHRLGHSESLTMDAPPDDSGKKNKIQQVASAVTYLQRYTLLAVTGLAAKNMDDDGAGSGDGEPELTDELLRDLRATKTDDAALAFWNANRTGLDPMLREKFKQAVISHRNALKGQQ